HPPDAPLAEKFASDGMEDDRFRKCLAAYDADPRFYTTSIAMQDLDEVRAGLGYDQIDLWGGSYGTRAALIYLREHGDHARVAILDGVAPLALRDRKSTRLNSSHVSISYAVFCLKKKKRHRHLEWYD